MTDSPRSFGAFYFSNFIMTYSILPPDIISEYRKRPIKWGFPSGPNSLGEITFRRTYFRQKPEGGLEDWPEVVARVVNGTFEILWNHCTYLDLPFDDEIARRDATEMYERIFDFKFSPPGRGLWMMGTDFVRTRGGASLNNCAMISTENIATEGSKPFCFLIDVSMLGVGVGFDTLGAGKVSWQPKEYPLCEVIIDDSREGWVDAWGQVIAWGLGRDLKPRFNYSKIRKYGEPIKGFGGTSSGPEPLIQLIERTFALIESRKGQLISSRDIVDLMNMAGACVVAGNVRRTAELSLGLPNDEEYLDLKDYSKNPERGAWGWTSNNSIYAEVGMDYSRVAERTRNNGEPGYFWIENAQRFGRMKDQENWSDKRVKGTNPCGEQSLESYELCCLVETYPHHHKDLEDYKKTLKYAYLYAKAVTLVPTHWKETNAVMLRNRRIGTSMSGVVQFLAANSEKKLISWCDGGYKTICHYDRVYSEWLCVRESLKKTSVKPSGTVSLGAGATPGAHYPTADCCIRRIRFAKDHPDLQALREAGYFIEPDVRDPYTMVVEFPVQGYGVPTESEVSLGKKIHLAALLQRHWADNQVSYTATFDPKTEGHLLEDMLTAYDSKLKGISFLPMTEGGAYPQMPYSKISREEYELRSKDLKKICWREDSAAHDSEDKYCDGLACTISK